MFAYNFLSYSTFGKLGMSSQSKCLPFKHLPESLSEEVSFPPNVISHMPRNSTQLVGNCRTKCCNLIKRDFESSQEMVIHVWQSK